MTPASAAELRAASAYWFLLSKLLLVYARRMTKLDYTGAHAALHMAGTLDSMAMTAQFEIVRLYGTAQGLPESDAREEILRQLFVAAYVLVGLRLVAWNVKLQRGPRAAWLGAMADHAQYTDDMMYTRPADPIAAIDSS